MDQAVEVFIDPNPGGNLGAWQAICDEYEVAAHPGDWVGTVRVRRRDGSGEEETAYALAPGSHEWYRVNDLLDARMDTNGLWLRRRRPQAVL